MFSRTNKHFCSFFRKEKFRKQFQNKIVQTSLQKESIRQGISFPNYILDIPFLYSKKDVHHPHNINCI